MNGSTEQAIRTLKEATLSALNASNMPKQFWDDALLDATFKYIFFPGSAELESPEFIFNGDKAPSSSPFLPFGTNGHMRIPNKTEAFEPKSVPSI